MTAPVVYTIHFESFRNPNTARKRVRSLKSLGVEAFSRRVDLPGKGTFYRILVGEFENRSQAREFQSYLQTEFHLGESRIISAGARR
jgi:cell division septation protein DedD